MSPPTLSLPVVGVGAVIWDTHQRVLLVRRKQPPRQGEWSIPGGKVEWGETATDALLREVREETGLVVRILQLIDAVDSIVRDESGNVLHHHLLVDYAARPHSGELRAGDDALELRWVSHSALDNYPMWSQTRRIIEASARSMP